MRLEVDHLFRGNARGHGANGFSKAVGSDERASEGTCIYFMVAVVQYLCNEKVDGTVSRSWRPCTRTRSSPLRQSLALLQRIARRIIPLAVAVAADLTQPRSSVHVHGAGVCVIWYHTLSCPMHVMHVVWLLFVTAAASVQLQLTNNYINNSTCGTLGR